MLHLLYLPHLAPQPLFPTPRPFSSSLAPSVPWALSEKDLRLIHIKLVLQLEVVLCLPKPHPHFKHEEIITQRG